MKKDIFFRILWFLGLCLYCGFLGFLVDEVTKFPMFIYSMYIPVHILLCSGILFFICMIGTLGKDL